MIQRSLATTILAASESRKVIIVLGPRQAGKTTLLRSIFDNEPSRTLWLNGDEPDVQALLTGISATRFKAVAGDASRVVIDEAQRIEGIGLAAKRLHDTHPDIRLVLTGSSSFELADQLNEPLTGRKWEFHLYPLSFAELVAHHGLLEEKRMIPHRLVYGSYPEVITSAGQEKAVLKQLSDSYLYKDILMLEGIKKPAKLILILQALALQLGNEVSYNEIGQMVGMDNQTVEKYIDVLEKAYVIFRLPAFSRNHRKELKRARKVYFYDNGIRNAILAQFGSIELRADKGALWENYLMSERMKTLSANGMWVNRYFWRTHDQQEIDYIEDVDGRLHAFEFKWKVSGNVRFPKSFNTSYPGSEEKVISFENVEEFLLL